jgi:arabinan endo-1,5-alpha-L-arabinosidase
MGQSRGRKTTRQSGGRRWLVLAVVGIASASMHSPPAAAQGLSGNLGIHDPSTVVKQNGKYFVYATGITDATGNSSSKLVVKNSDNRTNWSGPRSVFPLNTYPGWIDSAVPNFGGNLWAPEIAYFNNQYHLYYSASSFGSQVSGIGLVTSPTLDVSDPNFGWTDQGSVITSSNGSPYNAIDPSIIQTADGDVWMAFGSFWNGIYMTQLDPATGKRISPNSPTISVARHTSSSANAIEAPYLYERDGYYYLFVNWDSCCNGTSSTYNIRVGRSTSVTGPYFDQNGVGMINSGGGTLFLGTEGSFIGPGHMSVLVDEGIEWFGYHYYNGNANGAPTYNMRTLLWTDDGWPVAGSAFAPPPGDVDLDGDVDMDDFEVISNHLSETTSYRLDGDLNNDGFVDYDDFHLWKQFYNPNGAGSVAGVPEPAAWLLMVVAGAGFPRRRTDFAKKAKIYCHFRRVEFPFD